MTTGRPWMLRAHLRWRGTGSVMVLTVPYACWTQIELADLGILKASMHANVLARARHGRLDGLLLLLTSLEVRAYPAPRTVRHRYPPLQQKLWHELNYSWTSLQRHTRSTTGGPPFRVSSASPMATLHGRRPHRSRGRPAKCKPMATKPVGVQPPCTLRPKGQDCWLAGSATIATPLLHQIRELVA